MRMDLGWQSALAASIIIASAIADADFVVHAQQCPAGSQIFIDPRLVPRPVPFTYQQLINTMANPWVTEEQKNRIQEMYYAQFQPIQVPFRGGVVLVSPTDPCVQQYTGP